ncbi:pentatricopeptide repeat-containing protein At4g02750 isoform X2 [Cryptomeria japonica]|nr:pentatricopeptide repeat-containing protein At4g02750 isoform X2 [Cryptomeria japonica]
MFDIMPQRDVVSWNSMIAAYMHNGRLDEACCLFDRMPKRDNVSWNTVIRGYTQSDRIEDARELFDQIPQPDIYTWNLMISGYARNGRIDTARELFDKMPKRDTVSWNTMITGYAQCRRVDDARSLFDTIPGRNEISWNAMITGYVQNGRVDDACRLFEQMPEAMKNITSWTLMISGYAQNGRLEVARNLFDRMPERNVVSWNSMIMVYVQAGRIDDARKLFDEMPQKDVVSWNSVITGYSQTGRVDEARYLFDRMPLSDVVSCNAMIAGYAQNRRLEDARQLFDEMQERNVISWNALIAGYEQNGFYEEAYSLFSQMIESKVKPDCSSFTSILSACANLAALGEGKQIHQYIMKTGTFVDIPLANSLITMYAKCGSMEDSRLVFNTMPERDVISWNAIIVGNAQNGHAVEGLQLFKQLESIGIKPNDVTFVGVLCACSHAGLVEEGWQLFVSMSRDYSITPRVEHYASMVDLLGRSGLLNEAEDFIGRMPAEVQADAVVWGALLAACRVHGNADIAERVAHTLFKLEPHNSGPYVLLSNIYAAAGKWGDVSKVRKMMKERGVEKQPGCSWIEVQNNVHTFVVIRK